MVFSDMTPPKWLHPSTMPDGQEIVIKYRYDSGVNCLAAGKCRLSPSGVHIHEYGYIRLSRVLGWYHIPQADSPIEDPPAHP